MNTEFLVGPKLPPRECEVLANEANLALRGGAARFVFRLAPGFLPTIGWLGRFARLLAPLVEKKQPVEIKAAPEQIRSLRKAGLGLVADLSPG